MDIVILAGGRGTRLFEKTNIMPKALVPIGKKPILWHIMKIYSHFGHKNFIILIGYKGNEIQKYLKANLCAKQGWNVKIVNTGKDTLTQRRLWLARKYIKSDRFMLTYCDGVGNININKLISYHDYLNKKFNIMATITVTNPVSKYGIVKTKGKKIVSFKEKPILNDLVNIGFMVFETKTLKRITAKNVMLEMSDKSILAQLTKRGELGYYKHKGFWESMDTYKDYVTLNKLWDKGKPWKIW